MPDLWRASAWAALFGKPDTITPLNTLSCLEI